MRKALVLLPALLAGLAALPAVGEDKSPTPVPKNPKVAWKKTVIDKVFRSEGVAVADINKDGKMDIINGEAWYEAPTWKMHPIRKLGDYGDGLRGYSNSFCCWTEDLNGDGWVDVIVIGFPGTPCHWFENPKGKDGEWKKYEIWHSACNETPQYVDLFKNGKRVLIMGSNPRGKDNEGTMAYFTPGKDPTQKWQMHLISEEGGNGKGAPGTRRYSHGLGVGDLNGDGRLDVLCTEGWWEQPAKIDGKPWKFHKANLGDPCADMFVYDVDGDGTPDVLSTSAHKFGIWWHRQVPSGKGQAFVKHVLFKDLVSETHAAHFVDIDGDGLKDLVTGKRWWSHGRAEPGSDVPPHIYWLKASKGQDGFTKFEPHVIDTASGIGTQFVVTDFNGDGLPDVITSNKKGTFLIEQVRGK
jgi:hypothetical protein